MAKLPLQADWASSSNAVLSVSHSLHSTCELASSASYSAPGACYLIYVLRFPRCTDALTERFHLLFQSGDFLFYISLTHLHFLSLLALPPRCARCASR